MMKYSRKILITFINNIKYGFDENINTNLITKFSNI